MHRAQQVDELAVAAARHGQDESEGAATGQLERLELGHLVGRQQALISHGDHALDREALNDLLKEVVADKPDYQLVSQDKYYGEKNTWNFATFTHTGANGEEITGRLYVTIKNKVPYAIWFEAPTEKFNETFTNTFTIMLDGFRIDDPKPDSTS